MKITYQYTQTGYNKFDPTNPAPTGAFSEAQLNRSFQFNIGPCVFEVVPQNGANQYDVPAALLRDGAVISSNIVVIGGDAPHQDYKFLRNSPEHTYHVRGVISAAGGGVVAGVYEKEMAAGAVAGDLGKLVLYKGAATVADIGTGNWTERLIRPFIITASDLANRDTGWAQTATATAPTYDTVKKQIVNNAGDGYLHV